MSFALLCAAVAGVIPVVHVHLWRAPASEPTGETLKVAIPPRAGLEEVGRILCEKGLLKRVDQFVLLARIRRLDKHLRAGIYDLETGTSIWDLVTKLRSRASYLVTITIPEGLTAKRVAGLLSREMGIDSLRFVSLATSREFCAELGVDAPGLEGYLFPDTYQFYWQADEKKVARTMVRQFQTAFTARDSARARGLGLTPHQAVTLASIVEKEAMVAWERPVISAVFYNRLKRGWRLESCATVLYALGEHKSRLLLRDLSVESPYNTYGKAGLPPGPICNPGAASLKAAVYPSKTKYFYFVSRGDGTHIFTSSNKEHTKAKQQVGRSTAKPEGG